MKKIFTLLAVMMMAVTSAFAADDPDYLCFTAEEANTKVWFEAGKTLSNTIYLQYQTVKKDGTKSEWTDYTFGEENSITLANIGDKVYFKAGKVDGSITKNRTFSKASETIIFLTNYNESWNRHKVAASGNIMSLLDPTCKRTDVPAYAFTGLLMGWNCGLTSAPKLPATTLAESCYESMFSGCSALTAAPELPATTLAESCYESMFSGCSALVAAPELPATTLAKSCYSYMFSSSALTTAPKLPATTLAESCYSSMFSSCNNLEEAPALPATTLAKSCYSYMFSSSALTTAPKLPATTLAESCYRGMFSSCNNLEEAPALPATTLAESCYESMFEECNHLEEAPALPATTLAELCYSKMFLNCNSMVTVPELPVKTLAESCYSYMFFGCSALTTAPELPATILAANCYDYMFYGCTALENVKVHFTNWGDEDNTNTYDWLNGVAATGTFTCPVGLDVTNKGTFTVPENWAVEHTGKFIATATFENTDGTESQEIKAFVDEDFGVKVTLPAKDTKMYANKITATATMNGVTTLGMKENETRTHTKTFTSDRAESITLSNEIKNVYAFEGEKHFDVKVGDVDQFEYTVKFATEADGTKTITAIPSDVALAGKSWTEISSRLDATTHTEKTSECGIKAGTYVKNNNEMIKFIKDATFTGENLRKNLETLNDATRAYSVAEIKAVEFALAPESYLTIGNTSVALKSNKAITVTVANDDNTAYVPGTFLSDMKKDLGVLIKIEKDSEMKKQLIKDVLGYMKTIDSAVSGKRNVTVTVSFDEKTGISELTTHDSELQKDGKFIENGRVVIVKNGMHYNVNGQRIK